MKSQLNVSQLAVDKTSWMRPQVEVAKQILSYKSYSQVVYGESMDVLSRIRPSTVDLVYVDFVDAWDFADDGADGDDGFAFAVYHSCWGCAVLLHSVKGVASNCTPFSLREDKDFSPYTLPI